MKTILVPVDFSAATLRVCDAASALAKLIKARLVLLHVIEPPPVLLGDAYAYDAGALAAAVTAGEKYATRRLRALGRRYAVRKQAVQTVQVTGRPVAAMTSISARARSKIASSATPHAVANVPAG